jgi:hypothetical protein
MESGAMMPEGTYAVTFEGQLTVGAQGEVNLNLKSPAYWRPHLFSFRALRAPEGFPSYSRNWRRGREEGEEGRI